MVRDKVNYASPGIRGSYSTETQSNAVKSSRGTASQFQRDKTGSRTSVSEGRPSQVGRVAAVANGISAPRAHTMSICPAAGSQPFAFSGEDNGFFAKYFPDICYTASSSPLTITVQANMNMCGRAYFIIEFTGKRSAVEVVMQAWDIIGGNITDICKVWNFAEWIFLFPLEFVVNSDQVMLSLPNGGPGKINEQINLMQQKIPELIPTLTATLSASGSSSLSDSVMRTLSSTITTSSSPTAKISFTPTSTSTLTSTLNYTLTPSPTPTLSPTSTLTLTSPLTLTSTPTPPLAPTLTTTGTLVANMVQTFLPTVLPIFTSLTVSTNSSDMRGLLPTSTPTLAPTFTTTGTLAANMVQTFLPTVLPIFASLTISTNSSDMRGLLPTSTPTLAPTLTATGTLVANIVQTFLPTILPIFTALTISTNSSDIRRLLPTSTPVILSDDKDDHQKKLLILGVSLALGITSIVLVIIGGIKYGKKIKGKLMDCLKSNNRAE